jgi:Lysophospholipase L1 and related esterases
MYENKQFTTPIWQGNTVFWESFMPLEEKVIPLLYHADEILSLKNATGEKEYQYGKDYMLRDGKIVIPDGSAIEMIPLEVYHPKESDHPEFNCADGTHLIFSENMLFHKKYQYLVSYRHSDKWAGPVPQFHENKLKKTRQKLLNQEPFTLGFYGDSITEGYNSSGMKSVNVPPFVPVWPSMVWERLKTEASYDKIQYLNKAVGGKATNWGIENVETAFRETPPDLFILGFGMNDATGDMNRFTFLDNIKVICEKILTLNPECELLLVSTTLPNELAVRFYKDQYTHESLLSALAEQYGEIADIACMTKMHKYLLSKKRYVDMTGNNINHPNDFLARIYAQVILSHIITLS